MADQFEPEQYIFLLNKCLTFTESEAGRYKCVAENSAGRVETNFTLNIGHFSSPGELNTGEIIGVSITVILLVMIFLVIIAVLVLKVSGARRGDRHCFALSPSLNFLFSSAVTH